MVLFIHLLAARLAPSLQVTSATVFFLPAFPWHAYAPRALFLAAPGGDFTHPYAPASSDALFYPCFLSLLDWRSSCLADVSFVFTQAQVLVVVFFVGVVLCLVPHLA